MDSVMSNVQSLSTGISPVWARENLTPLRSNRKSSATLSLALPTYSLEVDEFVFDGTVIYLNPALEFDLRGGHENDGWEVRGRGLYASVFVQEPSIEAAEKELREDWLPFLWEEYALEKDSVLSLEARELKYYLLGRAGK